MDKPTKDTEPIPRPALLGPNWNGWDLDLVLKPSELLREVKHRGESGKLNVFKSEAMKAARFERYITYHDNLKSSARPDKALQNRLGSGTTLLRSLPFSDPLVSSEILLGCLYALSSSYEIRQDHLLFQVGDTQYKVKDNKIIRVLFKRERTLITLEDFDWYGLLTKRRRNHYFANPTAYAIQKVCEQALFNHDLGFQRVADTVLNIAPQTYLNNLLRCTPEQFQAEIERPTEDWQVMVRILKAENVGQALLDNVEFTDLCPKRLEVYGKDLLHIMKDAQLHQKLNVMSRLINFVSADKRMENKYVIGFYGKSWQW